MSTDQDLVPEDQVQLLPPPKPPKARQSPKPLKGPVFLAFLAWVVIAGVVIVIAAAPYVLPEREDENESTADQRVSLRTMEFQSKHYVGATQLGLPDISRSQMYQQAKLLDDGPLEQRMCFVILTGELAGAEAATGQLVELRAWIKQNGQTPRRELGELLDVLQRLYDHYEQKEWDAPSVTKQERELLVREFGWFGSLAVAPAGTDDKDARRAVVTPAQQTTISLIVISLIMLGMGSLGMIGCAVFFACAIFGRVHPSIRTGSPFAGFYAETFAIWMVLFLTLQFVVAQIPWQQGILAKASLASFASMAALAWPIIRGAPWRIVRQDIGLTFAKPFREVMWGFAAYVSSLPLLVVALFVMVMLMNAMNAGGAMGGTDQPSHPIVHWIAEGNPLVRISVVLLACVAAPITEEIMFRGVLYRHLREWTRGWRVLTSVLFSALANAIIFAEIHPQGVLGVPILATLAFCISIVREWRGSLIAPMTMHAINNGIATALLLTFL